MADARQWKICRGLCVSAFGLLSFMFRRMRIELNPQKLNIGRQYPVSAADRWDRHVSTFICGGRSP